jgi:aromatic ring-cleaving dioxygenase
MEQSDLDRIEGFHAHVYFDEDSKDRAWALRELIEEKFNIEMGRFHEKEVGPHPCWSYQVAFDKKTFGGLVPWLSLNRNDLVIFLHPNTGNDLEDHRDHAIWFGDKMSLKLEMFEAAK